MIRCSYSLRHYHFQITTAAAAILLTLIISALTPQTAQAILYGVGCGSSRVASLISAINQANTNSSDDTINLSPGCSYTLTDEDNFTGNGTGLPVIVAHHGKLTINGNNATIRRQPSSGNTFRIFYVDHGDLTLNDLTLLNGDVFGTGGAIYEIGGSLTLNDVIITNNSGLAGGGIGIQGDIPELATLTINNSTISNNTASGAILSSGGGMSIAYATAVIRSSTISGNQAGHHGGGIDFETGSLRIIGSTISGNQVTDSPDNTGGGGILSEGGPTTILNSTIRGNSAYVGAGVYNSIGLGLSQLILTNSTIRANTATTNGGGIYNADTLFTTNSTISGNSAGVSGADLFNTNDYNSVTATLNNSILANSTNGGDCVNQTGGAVKASHSLIEDATHHCGVTDGTNGNIVGQSPHFGTLTGNPQYAPLNNSSPAINAGDNSLINEATVNVDLNDDGDKNDTLNTDEPGNPRIIGGIVDMGAVESSVIPVPLPSASKTVSGVFEIGQTVTYTIVITNNGVGDEADNVGHEFSDVLPSQLTLSTAVASGGTPSTAGNTATWDGAIAADASITITITATINSGTEGQTVSNQGIVNYDSDGNGSNDSSILTDDPGQPGTSDPTNFVVGSGATLTIDKTATDEDGGNLIPGDILLYTITVGSTGAANAINTTLTDAIPANTTYIANSTRLNGAGVADNGADMPYAAGGFVNSSGAPAGQINGGALAVVTFEVTVNNPLPMNVTKIDNQATATADNVDSEASVDLQTPVTIMPALSLTKSDGGGSFSSGGTITYILSYQNIGNLDLDNVTLTDTVPTNTMFDTADSSPGWNCSPDNSAGSACTLSLGTLTNGVNGSSTFAVTVANPLPPNAVQISNSASIASGSVQASASDTTPLAGGPPIIEASKTVIDVNGGSLLPSDTLLYAISINNVGSTDTVNASLTDVIPANTTYIPGSTKLNGAIVSDNGSAMPYAAAGLLNSSGAPAGQISAGDSAVVVFAVTVDNPLPAGVTSISNQGTINGDNFGTAMTNTLVVPVVNGLTISKAFGAARLTVGLTTSLRFTITNPSGNPTLTGLSFSDTLPNGLVFDGTPASAQCGGTVSLSNASTLMFSAGTVGTGLSSCNIDALVKADGSVTGILTNHSSVVSADGGLSGTTGASASIQVGAAGATAVPAIFFQCENLESQSGSAMTSTDGIGAVHSGEVFGNVYCHIIANDGSYITSSAEIGIESVIQLGVEQAVDVFGELPGGYSVVPFDRSVQFCLRGSGEVLFLNAANAGRTVQRLAAVDQNGYRCVSLTTSGTVVLVSGASGLGEPPPAPATPSQSIELSNCRVTTTNAPLNLRAEPDTSAAVLAQLPYNLTLTAPERVSGWYRVIYLDGQGWLSATYLSFAGDCGQ